MTFPDFTVVSMAERPDLIDAADAAINPLWPEFMLNDPVADRFWVRLWHDFPAYQFVLLEPATQAIMAIGNSLPLVWTSDPLNLPGLGWDWALAQGFADRAAGRAPTTQCALSITITREYQGSGLSAAAVAAMKAIGRAHGLDSLIAPVRPNMKSRYPLIPIERYIRWKNDEGLPFDAWLRVHARLGAQLVKICPQSMTITGTVAEWEAWAGMRFPESGRYVIPAALVPVTIDREADRGEYVEPNVWVCHTLGP